MGYSVHLVSTLSQIHKRTRARKPLSAFYAPERTNMSASTMKSSSLDKCEHSVAAALAASFALDGHIDCPAHSNMPRSLLWSPKG